MTSTVLLIRESVWQSVVSDTYSTLSAVALIGAGVYVGSGAMQWAGFLLFGLTLIARASIGSKRRTPQEAADFLLDEFGVIANDRRTP